MVAWPPGRARYFLARHWLSVRLLPAVHVKSVGRGWPGAAMQKHASSPIHCMTTKGGASDGIIELVGGILAANPDEDDA